jgi:DeoR/GlpR family transcriptional regulator of sugar metabolism
VNKKDRIKDQLLGTLIERPNTSKQALSEQIGASPATIRKYLDELENDGKIRPTNKTRSGYAVVEAYRAN